MPTISVIIPIYNELDYLKCCIRSLVEHTKVPITLILANDASWSDTTTYCRKLATLQLPYITIRHTENRVNAGFTYTVNQGIELQQSDYYCLLNSDTIIGTDNWIQKIIEVGESDSRIGLLGPVSNNANGQSILPTNEIPPEYTPFSFANFLENVSIRLNPPLTLVNGFCYVIKDNLRQQIGLLDQNRYPHYGSEDDYSMRALRHNWKAICVESVFIWHKRSQSYKSNKNPLKDQSCRIFASQYHNNCIKDIVNADREALEPLRHKIRILLS